MNANGTGALEKAKAKPVTIKDYMEKAKSSISAALPKHISIDRFIRVALVAINQNPALAACTKESILSCVMASAQLGLEPGPLGHVHIIPYGGKATFQIGYKGLLELVMRTGGIENIGVYEVCKNDKFEYELGFNERLVHVPADTDRGEVVKYYAYAKTKAGGKYMTVMSRSDVEKHAKQYSQAYKAGRDTPWKSAFDEMAKKTVLLRLMKFLPKSIELMEAVQHNEEVRTDISEIQIDAADFTGEAETVVDFPTTSGKEEVAE